MCLTGRHLVVFAAPLHTVSGNLPAAEATLVAMRTLLALTFVLVEAFQAPLQSDFPIRGVNYGGRFIPEPTWTDR